MAEARPDCSHCSKPLNTLSLGFNLHCEQCGLPVHFHCSTTVGDDGRRVTHCPRETAQ